jgi:hypothetical protein
MPNVRFHMNYDAIQELHDRYARLRRMGPLERLAEQATRTLRSMVAAGCLVGALLCVQPSQQAHAATLTVCPQGCAYSTIQAAVSAARAGDTIVVAPGTYTEQLSIGKDLVLRGHGESSRIVAPAALVPDSDERRNVVEIRGPVTVSIDGFAVTARRWTVVKVYPLVLAYLKGQHSS